MDIYKAAFQSAPDPILVVDAQGLIVRANPEAGKTFGYPPKDLEGKQVEALMPERFAASHRELRAEFMSSPRARPMGTGPQLTARRRDGSEFPIDVMLNGAQTQQGLVAIAILRDVTESRRTQAQLKETLDRLQLSSEAAGMGYWTYDEGTQRFWCDPICARHFGGRPEDFPDGESVRSRILSEDRESRRQKALESLARHGTYESEFRVALPDGSIRWLRDLGRDTAPSEIGNGRQYAGVTYDISARKEAEIAAEKAVRQERQIYDLAADGIFLADIDGRYVNVNAAACRMLGMSREELLGKTVMDLIPPEDHQRLAMVKQKQVEGQNVVEEWNLLRKDGTLLPTEINAQIFPDGHWMAFVRDITERKQAESRQAELVKKLQRALSDVRILKGLLPICSHCKKIRNDTGKWEQLEAYLHQRTDADFSHGICPDCLLEHYPEFSGDTGKGEAEK